MTQPDAPCPGPEELFRSSPRTAGHVAHCTRCRVARRLGYERTLRASSCAEIEPLLAARILDQLDAEQERALLDHLGRCSDCMALAADLQRSPIGEALLDEGVVGSPDFPELRVVEPENYVRGREIGRGGMGRVLRARDRRLGRAVALKELLDERQRERFEQEARLTARLQHPAIVSVLEAGRWPSGESFYAMKHVAGRPLDRLIAEAGTLAGRLALLPNVIAVVEAVAYAHSLRIIHRDLKPANVLVGPFGETVVIDWGLAKDLARRRAEEEESGPYRDGDPGLTVGGAGTPAYMPPEQAGVHVTDERIDVYALGATLYHLLTGSPPYGAGVAAREVLARLQAGPPRPLAELEPHVPAALRAIVDKAMARDPDARYRSAGELADELRRFQSGQLVAAHSYTLRERVQRFVRRHRAPLALALASLLALGSLAGVSVSKIVAARRQAEAQLAKLLLERGQQELLRGAPSRAFVYLAEARARGLDTPALRALLSEAERPLDALEGAFVPGGGLPAAARVSPDGRRVATSGYDGVVRLWSVPGGRLLATLRSHRTAATVLRFSGDGRLLLSGSPADPVARLWDVANGAPRAALPLLAPLAGAAFEGDRPLTGFDDGALVWDAQTGLPREFRPLPLPAQDAPAKCAPQGGVPVHRASITADGATELTAGADGALRLWDTATCAQVAVYEWLGGRLLDARLSDDGRRLVAAGEQEVRSWRVRSRLAGDRPAPLATHRNASVRADGARRLSDEGVLRDASGRAIAKLSGNRLAFSGPGRVVGLGDGRAFIYDSTDGRLLRSLAVAHGPTLARGALQLSPRGDLLITMPSERSVALYHVATGARQALVTVAGPIEQVAFAPNGRRFFTAGTEPGVSVWDARGRLVAQLAVSPGLVTAAAFSPDGERVLTGGRDRFARVCDASSGMLLDVLGPFADPVDDVAFDADDALALVTAGGHTIAWDVREAPPDAAAIAAARARVPLRLDGGRLIATASPRDIPRTTAPAVSSAPRWPGLRPADVERLQADLRRRIARAPDHAAVMKALFQRGQSLYETGSFRESAEMFIEAYLDRPAAALLYNVAVANEKLQRYDVAAAYFERYLAEYHGARDRDQVALRIAALRAEAARRR